MSVKNHENSQLLNSLDLDKINQTLMISNLVIAILVRIGMSILTGHKIGVKKQTFSSIFSIRPGLALNDLWMTFLRLAASQWVRALPFPAPPGAAIVTQPVQSSLQITEQAAMVLLASSKVVIT